MRDPGGADGLAHRVGDQPRRTLMTLECDIAAESVGDDHIDNAARDVVTFDEAVIVETGILDIAQPLRYGAHDLVALQFFLANVQQTDRRMHPTQYGTAERGSHQGELDQIVFVADDVGAEVEHDALPALGRHEAGDCRTVDTRLGPQGEQRHGHQGTGIATGDHTIGVAVPHGVDCHAHAGIAATSQRLARLLVRAYRAWCVPYLDAFRQVATHKRFQLRLVTEEKETYAGILKADMSNSVDNRARGVVTAHGIQ